MGSISIDLSSRLCTNNVAITQSFEKPSFEVKNSIYYNGLIQNAFIKKGSGILLTSGNELKIEQAKNGANITTKNKSYNLPFQYLLSKHLAVKTQLAGEMVCHTYWSSHIFTIYKNGEFYSLIEVDEENNVINQTELDCSSAIISSVYQLKDEPILFTVKRISINRELYENEIKGFYITDLKNPILSHSTSDYIPLGEADSATIRMINGKKSYMFGVEDTDKNKARTFIWTQTDENNWNKKAREIRWFGVVSVRGDITGEPIPDPDVLSEPTRQRNGTYAWKLLKNDNTFEQFDLIGGYYINESLGTLSKIIIDTSRGGKPGITETNATQLRTNISVNDTKLSDNELSPMEYYITNYADSKSIYYDYGQGWLKTYVRKSSTRLPSETSGDGKIFDCYLYTFGCKSNNYLNIGTLDGRTRKESLMAKGKTKIWDYEYGKLNQRIYTIGDNNKGTKSIISSIPFTVEILPSSNIDYENERHLDMQMYSLMPLSFSYAKSLVSTASNDNSKHFTVIADDSFNNHTILAVNEDIYVIDKITNYQTAYKFLKIDKVADFNYRTNILDNKNLIIEDKLGNIELIRAFYPYNMEAILDIENLNLIEPSTSETDSNNTWYWAAGNNIQLTDKNSPSYMFPFGISLALFIDAVQLEEFSTETIEQKGSILKPLVKGLYDDFEKIDVFYTLSTTSTVIYYKTTNIIKNNELSTALYGNETYELEKEGTYYWVASAQTNITIFPIGIASAITGVNYITPTIDLLDNYSCRLYTQNNRLYMCYNYANQIYYGSQIFTIYGGNYYYDGQGIYYIGSDNSYNSNQFVCYALGLKFLSNSGSEAYFYSDWEKRLFIFTGSNTMQPSDCLTNVGLVIDSLYSSKEQILYMLTDDNKLIIRSQTDTAAIVDIPEDASLVGTVEGAGVIYPKGFMLYSPREKENYQHLPYKLETEYLGMDGKLLKCHSIDFLLYNIDQKNTIKVIMKIHTLAGIEEQVEKQEIVITPKDWKGRNYRLRFSPRMNTGNSFKAILESENKVSISYLGFNVDEIENGKIQSAPRSGRR